MARPFFTGVPTAGVNPTLLADIQRAVIAAGGTGVVVTSAKRAPGLAHNDVKNSNHITGNAIDGYAVIDGKQIPIGTALKASATRYGLRSGDVAGFDPRTPGGFDPIHVDDGANVGGVTPSPSGGQDSTTALIIASALKHGIDPRIPLAVAPHEGLSGAIGDGGHAFGPFQLNDAGGVITGKFPGWTPAQKQAWAMSPAGIDYAIAGGAAAIKGLSGPQAVTAWVNNFERPANKPAEVKASLATFSTLNPVQRTGTALVPPRSSPTAPAAVAPPPVAAPRGAPVAPPPAPPPTAPAGDHTDPTDLALQLLTRQQPAPFQPTQAPIGSTNIPAVHIEAPNAGTSPPVVQAIRLAQLHAQDSAGPSTTASFAKWLHNADGLLLPGSLHGQLTSGTEQTSPTPLPRDLLFFGNGAPTHQGISTGGHTFLHFSHGGRTIHISSLANPHYGNSLRSVRSLFG